MTNETTPNRPLGAAPMNEEEHARMETALRPLLTHFAAEGFTEGEVMDTALNIIAGSQGMVVVPVADGVFLVGFREPILAYCQEAVMEGEEIPDVETPSPIILQ